MKNDLGNISMIISIHFIFTVGNISFDSIFAFYYPFLTCDANNEAQHNQNDYFKLGIPNLLK